MEDKEEIILTGPETKDDHNEDKVVKSEAMEEMDSADLTKEDSVKKDLDSEVLSENDKKNEEQLISESPMVDSTDDNKGENDKLNELTKDSTNMDKVSEELNKEETNSEKSTTEEFVPDVVKDNQDIVEVGAMESVHNQLEGDENGDGRGNDLGNHVIKNDISGNNDDDNIDKEDINKSVMDKTDTDKSNINKADIKIETKESVQKDSIIIDEEKDTVQIINNSLAGVGTISGDEELVIQEYCEKGQNRIAVDLKRKIFLDEVFSYIKILAAAILIAFFVNNFIISNTKIPSGSMENTIHIGDKLIGSRLTYRFEDPERGDIIIFKWPDNRSKNFIKRIVGTPGDTINIVDGVVYINGDIYEEDTNYYKETPTGSFGPYTVPDGCYFVLGDNRNDSKDSRYWENTFVPKEDIVAKAVFRYWPLNKFKVFKEDD